MAFPFVPVVLVTAPLIAIKIAIDSVVKPYTDALISRQLTEAKNTLRETIVEASMVYEKNFRISVVFDAVTVVFAILVYLVFKINMVSIGIISVCTIIILIRFLTNTLKCIRMLFPYSGQISAFMGNCIRYKSVSNAGKKFITDYCSKLYRENTTKFVRTVHEVASRVGAVKSFCAIKNDAIAEVFSLINEKQTQTFIRRVFFMSIAYSSAVFLLKLCVFSLIMKMNTLELLAYPFIKILPALAKNISFWQ
jgi:hypothetical protein